MELKDLKNKIKSAADSIKEAVNNILNSEEELTPEERIRKIIERLDSDNSYTKEDALRDLEIIFEAEEVEEDTETLWEKATMKTLELKEMFNDKVIDPVKNKIDEAKKNEDVKKLKSVLNMQSSLSEILNAFEDFGKNIFKK